MSNLVNTLNDLNTCLVANKVEYLLTRFNANSVSDLDILVKGKDFHKAVGLLEVAGYKVESHDHALGGRVPGMQVNLVKSSRIKIDLHQSFTWRKSYYADDLFWWQGSVKRKIEYISVDVPAPDKDMFLILVNILFEKTYIAKEDWIYINDKWQTLFSNPDLLSQAKKYHYLQSWRRFGKVLASIKRSENTYFLPVSLILYTYYEKAFAERFFELRSFLYYVYFRIRYVLNQKLPY